MPITVPEVVFSDQRLDNGLRVVVAEDHLAPVVAVNLWYDVGSKHEVHGQDGLRPPLRARHVPGLAPRREGRAHRARPGGRRDDERLDLARSDELLRDAAGAPAGARAVARGRPDGDAARRAQPGEPRQPARGRQEREALVLRQPAVRLVPGEAPGPPVPATSHPYHHSTIGSMDDLDAASIEDVSEFFRTYYAPNNAVLSRRRRRRHGRGPRAARSATSARIPAEPGHPAAAATCRCRRRSAGSAARSSTTRSRCRASTSGSARRSSATRGSTPSTWPARSCRRKGQPAPPPSRPRRAHRPGRRDLHARVHRWRVGHRGLGHRPAGRRRRAGRGRSPRGARPAGDRARQRRRARPRQGADRIRRAGRAPARRGTGRPPVDVRDAVRRPGSRSTGCCRATSR